MKRCDKCIGFAMLYLVVPGSQPLSQNQLGQESSRPDRHFEEVGKGCGCGCRTHTTAAEALTGSSLMQFSVLSGDRICTFCGCLPVGVTLVAARLSIGTRVSRFCREPQLSHSLLWTPIA